MTSQTSQPAYTSAQPQGVNTANSSSSAAYPGTTQNTGGSPTGNSLPGPRERFTQDLPRIAPRPTFTPQEHGGYTHNPYVSQSQPPPPTFSHLKHGYNQATPPSQGLPVMNRATPDIVHNAMEREASHYSGYGQHGGAVALNSPGSQRSNDGQRGLPTHNLGEARMRSGNSMVKYWETLRVAMVRPYCQPGYLLKLRCEWCEFIFIDLCENNGTIDENCERCKRMRYHCYFLQVIVQAEWTNPTER